MRRILTYGGYFEAFISTLSEAVVKKIDYGLVLLKTQERVPTKFVKHIEDRSGVLQRRAAPGDQGCRQDRRP